MGANVQIEGYDISRLTEGVFFRDNGENLAATDHPVPDES